MSMTNITPVQKLQQVAREAEKLHRDVEAGIKTATQANAEADRIESAVHPRLRDCAGLPRRILSLVAMVRSRARQPAPVPPSPVPPSPSPGPRSGAVVTASVSTIAPARPSPVLPELHGLARVEAAFKRGLGKPAIPSVSAPPPLHGLARTEAGFKRQLERARASHGKPLATHAHGLERTQAAFASELEGAGA